MQLLTEKAHFTVDGGEFRRSVNREPFGFSHNLHELELFSFDSLRELAAKYVDADYFIAGSVQAPGTPFYSLPCADLRPLEAIDRLDFGAQRVLMKRPEKYDARFRDLLDALFDRVLELRGGLRGEKLERLEGSVLISSAAATTPFHFDPEVSFFFQIQGPKIYHVYSPSILSEQELERFYVQGVVDIGQVEFAGRDPARECVFNLAPGKGLHQPQNAAHWVETRELRSVSYVFVFETDATRASGRARAYNYYLRKLGGRPAAPGARPELDALKAKTMQIAIPFRKQVKRTAFKALRRQIA